MHTPNPHESKNKASSLREGYEVTDVSVSGIIVFLVGLFISVGVFFVFCFGMGKVINNALIKRDGPPNKWHAAQSPEEFENMQSNPAGEQKRLQQLTQSFPTPRLQTDNGAQDLVNLNHREDLLLDHYSWVNESQGKVRIPIQRAMELIARQGLPVESKAAPREALMFGDKVPTIHAPLTDGYALTAYEQEEAGGSKVPGEQTSSGADNN
jgi:hypothetical protein